MDQLVQQIAAQTGLTTDQAREVVQTVVSYIKEKLPAPIAAQVDGFLNNQIADDIAQQAISGIGGLFNKQ